MIRIIIPLLCFVAFFGSPETATAQNWLTREACDFGAIKAEDVDFQKALSQKLASNSSDGPVNGVGKLWKVRHPNETTSYIWGSFHASDKLYIDQAAVLLDVIAKVDAAIFEHTFRSMKRKDLARFNSRDRWSNSITASHWLQKLHPSVKKAVVNRFKFWNIDEGDLAYLQASAAVDYLLASPCEDFNRGAYPTQDNYIQMLADHQRLKIVGLEVPDALSKRNYGFWNNKISISIINVFGAYLVDPKIESREIAVAERVQGELYRLGEIGIMMQLDQEYVRGVLGEEEGARHLKVSDGYLLDERNENWIKRLIPALKQQSNLIVVGAFHLPGETGLIESLRREGMLVSRIALPEEEPSR